MASTTPLNATNVYECLRPTAEHIVDRVGELLIVRMHELTAAVSRLEAKIDLMSSVKPKATRKAAETPAATEGAVDAVAAPPAAKKYNNKRLWFCDQGKHDPAFLLQFVDQKVIDAAAQLESVKAKKTVELRQSQIATEVYNTIKDKGEKDPLFKRVIDMFEIINAAQKKESLKSAEVNAASVEPTTP